MRRDAVFILLIICLVVLTACNNKEAAEPKPVVQLPTVTPAPTTQPLPTDVATEAAPPPANTQPVITSSTGCRVNVATTSVQADAVFNAQSLRTIQTASLGGLPVRARSNPQNVTVPEQARQSLLIIQFTPESTPEERQAYVDLINGRVDEVIEDLNTYVVIIPPGLTPEVVPESPIVVAVEADFLVSAMQYTSVPTDPRFHEQWAMNIIGAPQAWAELPVDAETVIIAVIDSGVCLDHPDLAGRLVPGYDFVEDDTVPQDEYGHGCGVAGIIAANMNDAFGIAGVAPNAQIMPLRVLDANGLGGYSEISRAIIYAVDHGADIINLSLAGPRFSQVMADAVDYAAQNGVWVIAAAGNSGTDVVYYPAGFESVIAVGSVDPTLTRSSFSNYGAHVEINAPGRDILTTNIAGGHSLNSGTSFAAPMVSGVAAMARAFNMPLNVENGVLLIYPPSAVAQCGIE